MKIIWYASHSLDGFIADAVGDTSWVTAEDEKLFYNLVRGAGAVVVGRATFEQQRGFYPLPGATTYVLTRNADLRSDDPAVQFVSGGPLEVMRSLAHDGHTYAALAGGGEAAGAFAAANLIDEARLSSYPHMLGGGTRLLGSYLGRVKLAHVEGYTLPGGIVHGRYEVG